MKTVIEMAEEAGWGQANAHDDCLSCGVFDIEAFAELVTEQANARANTSWALMCKKMVAAENEACAKVVLQREQEAHGSDFPDAYDFAKAIRARANT